MQLEKLIEPKENSKFRMRFNAIEAETVTAVYAEDMHYRAMRGNTSFSSHELHVTGVWVPDQPQTIKTDNPDQFVARLEGFSERTEEAMSDIARNAGAVAFRNTDIAKRHILGTRARLMAEELRVMYEDMQPELEQADEARAILAEFDLDAALKQMLPPNN